MDAELRASRPDVAGSGPWDTFDVPSWFDEEAYLAANSDVAEGVACGDITSAYEHYVRQGWREQRRLFLRGKEPQNGLHRWPGGGAATALAGPANLTCNIEAMRLSPSGGLLIIGWLDDRASPLAFLRVVNADWMYSFAASALLRVRRADVEAAVGGTAPHAYGFIAFCHTGEPIGHLPETCSLTLGLANGAERLIELKPTASTDAELRDLVLSCLAQAEFFGNQQVEAIRACGGAAGQQIIRYNRALSRNLVAGAYVHRFGDQRAAVKASLVVCLYGKAEFVFLQNALFAGRPGFEDCEIVWISNSPELAERLLAETRLAHALYGIPQTLVLLPGNAGFGAANNAAVGFARSDRVIIINPDVFPRDRDWARKHAELVAQLPAEQTRLFGVPLYYDDGSLMHGGMYFEFDTGVSVDPTQVTDHRMVRVEHYGKGAPAWSDRYTQPRPVPAVTGAFMSCDRAWFEGLGGFSEDYVFGHYEDADLCLKSLRRGAVPWLHDLRLWHLEGKGSTRLALHEGGSIVNRWLFAQTWADEITNGLLGPEPPRLLALAARAMRRPAPSPLPGPKPSLPPPPPPAGAPQPKPKGKPAPLPARRGHGKPSRAF